MEAPHKPREFVNLNNRLLIVDDEVGVCLLLKEWLTETGFSCQTALSGDEASACYRNTKSTPSFLT